MVVGPGPKFPQSGSSVTLGLLSHSVNASGGEWTLRLDQGRAEGIWRYHSYLRSPSSGTQMKLPVFKWLQKASVLTSHVFDLDVGAPGGRITFPHSSCRHCLSWVFSKVWRVLHLPTSYLSFSHFLAAHTLFSMFVRHTLFQTSLVAHSSCSCFQRCSVTHVAIPVVTLSVPPGHLEQNSLAPAVRHPGSIFWSLRFPSQTSYVLLLRRCSVLGVGAAPSGRAARCDSPSCPRPAALFCCRRSGHVALTRLQESRSREQQPRRPQGWGVGGGRW